MPSAAKGADGVAGWFEFAKAKSESTPYPTDGTPYVSNRSSFISAPGKSGCSARCSTMM